MNILDIINIPFGYVIRFCSWLMGNQYLPALFLFAVIIEIVLLPFGVKQQKNSIKQAKLRPKEMAIRKKYAGRDDQPTKQKMTMEVQELYQKEGYNPMGGCLPLLIQLPIIYALYAIVTQPLTYICRLSADAVNQVTQIAQSFFPTHTYSATNHLTLLSDVRSIAAEHGLGIFSSVEGFSQNVTSLADLPDLSFGAINLGQNPDITVFNWLLIVPVLTFVTYFISMKVNRKLTYQPAVQDQAMGCSNNMMDITMPLFSTFIAFSFPAVVGIYWIFKSLLGMLKQFILSRVMPIPKFTDEDYKAAEKELNARQDTKAKTTKSGRVVRSLHHIDDEDFADTAEAGRARREALEAQQRAEAEQKAKGKGHILSAAPLKEDKPEEKQGDEKSE